ncbi:MAG: beta-N-acetylhexosaminidase [Rhodospirillaceae bacterium]|jgi:beta-N-acetylhexosaminidase|nr:beta-N-acetylhexosaminidase [Rhodospirillaceae bacterium]
MKAAIFGCAGLQVSESERCFFSTHNPVGFILFGRNIESPSQVRSLVETLKSCVDHHDPLILIDQEGGRVARLRPPHWPEYPTAATFGSLFAVNEAAGEEAVMLNARLIADDLSQLGINVDCAPVLDIFYDGAADIIGDRAYDANVETVARLGRKVCDGLLSGGVLPVIKHIPGHGRAVVDSHLELPVVDTSLDTLRQTDFAPFRLFADAPLAMTAHVIYSAIDPHNPATVSKSVIADIVRGDIGFDGLLMSDDLSMKALVGTMRERAVAAIAAGCDVVLHCNGDMEEMTAVADACPSLSPRSTQRLESALAALATPGTLDRSCALNKVKLLMEGAA